MVSEGRLCCRHPRLVCGVPRLCVGVPLVVYPVALLNGGCGVCCDARLRVGSGTLHCSTPSCIVQSLFSLCVCCHSIVGLGLCLCDRVVLLWNSGGGLCWVEGCVVSTVHCHLFMCCGVCVVLWVVKWRRVRV